MQAKCGVGRDLDGRGETVGRTRNKGVACACSWRRRRRQKRRGNEMARPRVPGIEEVSEEEARAGEQNPGTGSEAPMKKQTTR